MSDSVIKHRKDYLIDSPFPHPWWSPFDSESPQAKTVDEWNIINISNDIKLKPDWVNKFKNEQIRSKWESEIKAKVNPTVPIDSFIKLIFDQLEWTIEQEKSISPFKISVDDRIVVSDSSIDETLQKSFIKQVDELKASFKISNDLDEEVLDYHPGTNNQVIDLVHPSLYPLQYGVTPVFNESGELVIHQYDSAKVVVKNVNQWGESKNFQWLPSIFKYNQSLKKFEFKSYINNLHPIKNKSIYDSIEKIFTSILPGLNHVLSLHATKEHIRIKFEDDEIYDEKYHEGLKKFYENDKNDEEGYEAYEKEKLQYLQPPRIHYEKPTTNIIDVRKFNELKVITKIADIELTPENPKYNGGSWHVEGTISEDIIATIIYYYDFDNITESKLSFRAGFDNPEYEQNDYIFCEQIYGVRDEDSMSKVLGGIEAKSNRILIFPNIFQHKVEPFELVDKSKKGYRRIMALFIVDPFNKNVITTNKVPIQQKNWWNENEIINTEIKDKIKQLNKDLPQSLKQVKEVREKLMSERSVEIDASEEYDHPYERTFSLCEH